MTPKQAAFIREYCVDRNGTQAAIRAGYSSKTANEQAARLLANVNIRAAVDELERQHAESCGVTKQSLTKELEEARLLAAKNDQAAAAVSATMGKAKIHGLLVDKQEQSVVASVTFKTVYE